MSRPDRPSSRTPPEVQRFLEIVSDYQRGKLTLEDAAPQLRDASRALPGPVNLSMSPSVWRLFAEAARLDGRTFPEYVPDPDRHAGGGPEMRHRLAERAWQALENHPRKDQALSIRYHFAALTEHTARAIATWLGEQGQERIEVESPTQADADDWSIQASTPPLRWTQVEATRWAEVIDGAPYANEASFTGWSV